MDSSYRGVTVDTRYTSIRNILQYVDGSKWVVDYYSQTLGKDSELSPQQLGLNAVYQQYRRISRLQMAVSSALDLAQNEETREFTAQGSATMLPGVIPNKGDMFLADIGDGQEGLFAVTNTQKLTHLKDALYSIDYELVDYAGRDSARLKDLQTKIVEEFTFVSDYLTVGEKPIITTAEFTRREEMIQVRMGIIDQYFQDFYSHEHSLLLVPNQSARTYDPFVARYVCDIVAISENPLVGHVDFPAIGSMPGMRQNTLWDALRRLTAPMVRQVARRVGVLDSGYWRGQVQYAGIYFTGVSKVAYPLDPRTDVDAPYESCAPSPSGAIADGNVRRSDLSRFVDDLGAPAGFNHMETATGSLPYVVPVVADDRYVFTDAFYQSEGSYASHLERLTHQMLRHEPIDKTLLLDLARKATLWPNLERFYYSPVVLTLLKVAIQTS